ncbi:MAG: FKBP-type peptidyl-prolyl cis-trans isomerase [Gammaproteobacteria bacterium]
MKKRFLTLCLVAFSAQLSAAGTSLESDTEKYSYAIGINFAQSLMRQGVPLDADAVFLAIRDALDGAEPRLSAEVMSDALRKQAQKAGERKREMASANLERGKAYRAQNEAKAGVTTLPNGIQYEVLRKGAGEQPDKGDTVTVHYVGTLTDGREFDSSRRRGEAATFPLGDVIQGWQEIMPLMRVGSRWTVTIPPDLAYGVNGAGSAIGPNETLVFEIELLDVADKAQ